MWRGIKGLLVRIAGLRLVSLLHDLQYVVIGGMAVIIMG